MENSSNALMMAGAILLFIIALSVGIIQYSRIMAINDGILTVSEKYDKTAEDYTQYDTSDKDKLFTGAEIANQILELTRAPNSASTDLPARKQYDYKYYRITVDSKTFTKNDGILNLYNQTLSTDLYNISNPRRLYRKVSESWTTQGVVVTYRFVRNINV